MEPLLLSEGSPHRKELTDLAAELIAKSAGFRRSLPLAIQSSLAEMVRAMNCYYSNLIEGHDTHPIAIERALQNNYSTDPRKRDLQLEARAHITVQQWIDRGSIKKNVFSSSVLCEIHRRFCSLLPDDLLWVENPDTKEKMRVLPGELRQNDVIVGQHIAVSPKALPNFLSRFESAYSQLGKVETILALAAAHHRFLWIHPFLDGNGRVARLMSHATLLDVLDTGGIWSIARGLARNVATYKAHLANCDLPRRNDLDGRGNLSEEALVSFTRFFLETCIDQIRFMENLMQPDLLRTRILLWAKEEIQLGKIPPQSIQILEAILYRGEVSRNEMSSILNVGERHTRRLIAALIEKGILTSDSSKSPLKLVFPATLASRWMPGLFPASDID
ncbi:cell filamentation protein Fic [Gammaproteobacteria bacterium SCGC AG-212-F23]|nr:cell filamentation protein Fic [Gammaproteobacteria bacterium SCGC AG-212-F23]